MRQKNTLNKVDSTPLNSKQVALSEVTTLSEFNTTLTNENPSMDIEEWNFLRILNAHRESKGLTKVKASHKLTLAAEWMSNDMATRNILSHVDSLGRNAQARVASFGYTAPGGENVARVGATGQIAFNAWLASTQGHKEEMETPSRRAVGISRVAGSQNTWFWTADFGNSIDQEIIETANTPTPTNTPTPSPTPTSVPLATATPTTYPNTQNTPTPTPTQSQKTAVFLDIKLQGIGKGTGDNIAPKRRTRIFTVVAQNSSGQTNHEITGEALYDEQTGKYHAFILFGQSISSGDYSLKIKVDNSIYKNIPGIYTAPTSNPTTPRHSLDLTSGDITSDNELTIEDYNLVMACFKGLSTCTNEIKTRSDLNDDGITLNTIDDISILQRGFRTRSGD